MSPERARRIDVHAHYVPDFYRRAAEAAGFGKPDGMPGIPAWSLANALAVMDRNDIEVAMLSISAPGIHFGNAAATVTLAREVNDFAADIVAKHPHRFGFFAMLPLPDVEASLAEIAYAFDTLRADGIVITSNQSGIYPGDPRYEPVFAELGRRGASLFIHPTSPSCSCPGGTDLNIPRPIVEFMCETTRVVCNLILTGTTRRHPGLRLIIPHAGAALPLLAESHRRGAWHVCRPPASSPRRRFSRKSAASIMTSPDSRCRACCPRLLAITSSKNLLYGSDWPHTPEAVLARLARRTARLRVLRSSTKAGDVAWKCPPAVSGAFHR